MVIGANHHTADANTREKLYLDQTTCLSFLNMLRKQNILQAVIISTCDRIEIILCCHDMEDSAVKIQNLLAKYSGITISKIASHLFRYYDDDAISHIFDVACALDSQMIGEAQILGQLKDAFNLSHKNNMIGSELNDFFQATYTLAKRVRSQTQIGEGAVSVAAAAVKTARDLHGDLTKKYGLIIGLGDIAINLLEQFNLSGMSHWIMTGTSRRTERLAIKRGCHFIPIAKLNNILENIDVIITASGNGRFILDMENCHKAIKTRRNKPILIFDCGIPADADPNIDKLNAIYRYSLEDIESLAEYGQTGREEAAQQAKNMAYEAVGDYRRHLSEQDGIPALIALRSHFDLIRINLLNDHPNLDAKEATRLLINRLLHQPSSAIRILAADGDMADFKDIITINRILEQLFNISGDISKSMADKEKK